MSGGFERNQLNQPNPDLFSPCVVFWEDFLSASSEDSSSSSLTEAVEPSEILCARGIGGTWNLGKKKKKELL